MIETTKEYRAEHNKTAVEDAEVTRLVEAMNALNQRLPYTPYKGYEITETRKKYHLLNSILSNEQRSGVMLIDRQTHFIYKSVGYGKAGRFIGTVESLTKHYNETTTTDWRHV